MIVLSLPFQFSCFYWTIFWKPAVKNDTPHTDEKQFECSCTCNRKQWNPQIREIMSENAKTLKQIINQELHFK